MRAAALAAHPLAQARGDAYRVAVNGRGAISKLTTETTHRHGHANVVARAAVTDHRLVGAPVNGITTSASRQAIVARFAVEVIVAAAAGDGVGAVAALEQIV